VKFNCRITQFTERSYIGTVNVRQLWSKFHVYKMHNKISNLYFVNSWYRKLSAVGYFDCGNQLSEGETCGNTACTEVKETSIRICLWPKFLKKRSHLEDLGVDGKVILILIIKANEMHYFIKFI